MVVWWTRPPTCCTSAKASGFDPAVPATVVELNPATGATRSTPLTGDPFAQEITIDPTSRTLYVLGGFGFTPATVSVVSLASFTETTVIPKVGAGPISVAVDPATHTLLASTVGGVVVIDTRSNTIVDTLPAADGNNFILGVAVNPTTHLAYFTSSLSGFDGPPPPSGPAPMLRTYDTASRTLVRTAPLSTGVVFLAVDPGTGLLHASTPDVDPGVGQSRPGVVTIDPSTATVTDAVAADDNPMDRSFDGIAIDYASHAVYYPSGTQRDSNGNSVALLDVAGPAGSCPTVIGAIGAKYAALGGCTGFLGRPTSSEQDDYYGYGGRVTHFEHGDIYYSPATGAHAITGAIEAAWLKQGGPASRLGYPTSDEFGVLFGRANTFQHGFIYFNPLIGAIPITF